MKHETLRSIPSVDRLARELGEMDVPRPVIVAIIRRELAVLREQGLHLAPDQIEDRVRGVVEDLRRSRIGAVINGTGIVIHTNFGRSPLSQEAVKSLTEVASNYSNLEYDLTHGTRGGRAEYVEHNLAVLCESERATIVNNCAAALVLILRTLTSSAKRQVVISRGELVQIGGGFRVPEILQAGGAELREVGTTNKTTLKDYERAIGEQTAMILRVHRSNFYMDGFVESPALAALAEVAKNAGVPLVEDLGSGAMFETSDLSGEHEPTPADMLKQGADLVCFSGDKLFGGPQAGIIAGRAALVEAVKAEPMFRALRCDKLVLAALQATVESHLRGEAGELPSLAMMKIPVEELRSRASKIAAGLGSVLKIGAGESQVGGGCLPRTTLPSITLELRPGKVTVDDLAARLRRGTPPVVGYIADGCLKIDLRTIFPRQDETLAAAIKKALGLE
jgi:L-seryl-tRNA(Ser) seleniumtransferase